MRGDLPSGTVTFLFTDVEGSTKLLYERGDTDYAKALAEHRRILREAFGAHGGVEVDTQGDAFFIAFPTAPDALRAAVAAQKGLAVGPIRVRMALHTGTPHRTEEGYVGVDVHRAARIAACGHGGQVLVSASTAALVDRGELRDLGEHRLKDLSAPERIFQFGDNQFPPLASLHRTNLPIASTPFMGRQKELAEVVGLLSRGDVRLLTLSGPGGTGKTRLALQAGAELSSRYVHGVWWVPLATLRDPALVLEAAGRALDAKDGVADHIGDRSMLLFFDNFEQVVEAAGQVAGLLSSCPHLDLLVTSREPLHLTGEQEYPVSPFAHEEGVGFFLARARAVKPDFNADVAVSEICRRLDDLPLALELAAARVKALSSGQILDRLERRLPFLTGGARDLPERQRTLRGAIEWSYDLLRPEEQRLFARLAIFSGGCMLEAAEHVTGADLDTLQSLVDKNLVRFTEARFWMLETIREYAAEQLSQSDEVEKLERRHAEYFLALAEEAEPKVREETLRGRGQSLDQLEREHDNLRAALDRLAASGESELVLRLAAAVSLFWQEKGHVMEGRRRLESALRASARPTAARARALSGLSTIAVFAGDVATGKLRAEEALALHRALGDNWQIAYALWSLGYAIAEEGDMARARPLFEESVRLFRGLGDEHHTMAVTRSLAWSYETLGELAQARALHEDNLRLARVLRDERYVAITLGALAMVAVRDRRIEDAFSLLRENLPICRDLGDPFQTAVNLCRVACALTAAGRAETAAALLLSRSEVLFEEIGAQVPWVSRMNEETLNAIRAQLDDDAFARAWEKGRVVTIDDAVGLAVESLG
jgi:predicted ATPase/class 3 adenylate cyclase